MTQHLTNAIHTSEANLDEDIQQIDEEEDAQ